MKHTIQIADKEYTLDAERAEQLGVLKKNITISLSSDEAAVAYALFEQIGGPSAGARGCVDSLRTKIFNATGGHISTDLNTVIKIQYNELFFCDTI